MAKLIALLVGVNPYENLRPVEMPTGAIGLVDASMRSAGHDVEKLSHTLSQHVTGLGYERAMGAVLTGTANTRRRSVLRALERMCMAAKSGDHIVFYFSGHSWWIRMQPQPQPAQPPADTGSGDALRGASGDPTHSPDEAPDLPAPWYEVVLCPSDTQWVSPPYIAGSDIRAALARAPQGVTAEVILETCAARGVPTDFERRPFGFEPEPHRLAFIRWDAAQLTEYSHSGPVPPCKDGPSFGLFTYFFCENFMASPTRPRKRNDLREQIRLALVIYANELHRCCGKVLGDGWGAKEKQTPSVRSPWSEALDLPALARPQPNAPVATQFDWMSEDQIHQMVGP